uniref:Protein kinase domain-containing protein n=1 Tax=Araucaria cunninghamii TaxID=56994 RepID=A0A0D6R144_ARACU
MAHLGNQPREIGNYVVFEQIGSGSFSVVWHAKHKFTVHEVAIKEISTGKLQRKLLQSLQSEIEILQKINHPNITRLYEIIEDTGKIYLCLEYCPGGDLSTYIQNHGRVSEDIARHFMRQLAAGLRVLRENHVIHRDLKPQNLLLSTDDSNAVLKIADFGFARPLQTQDLAETVCGSPLYMAPEILQCHKYDAKADLWSVGTILFQLVTGRTPFSGHNQYQLLQNILKSNELSFPPEVGSLSTSCIDLCHKLLRRNSVERLTFEEFFNHEFLLQTNMNKSPKSNRTTSGLSRASSLSGGNPLSDTGESSQEDCLPFPLDDDLHGQVGNLSFSSKKKTFPVSYSSGLMGTAAVAGRNPSVNYSIGKDFFSRSIEGDMERQVMALGNKRESPMNPDLFKSLITDMEREFPNTPTSKELDTFDIDQDYVFVPAPSTELSSSSLIGSGPGPLPDKLVSSLVKHSLKSPAVSEPMPIIGAAVDFVGSSGSHGNQSSIRSGTSPGSVDLVDVSDQPSTYPRARLQSLMQCAYAISELANEKLKADKQLEAFSLQLVCLAIWKQALRVCYDWAASATEGSSYPDVIESSDGLSGSINIAQISELDFQGAAVACSQTEREFILAIERAERLAPLDGSAEMPDAMEAIFQEALNSGRKGAVEELMGNVNLAASLYSKSATLLRFLLVEATSLTLNPPFVLNTSDRLRLRRYIDAITIRQSHCSAHEMSLPHPKGLQSV